MVLPVGRHFDDQLKQETLDENIQQIMLDQVVQEELQKSGEE